MTDSFEYRDDGGGDACFDDNSDTRFPVKYANRHDLELQLPLQYIKPD